MASLRVRAVCGACAPHIAAIPPILDHIARFLLPVSSLVISRAIATANESLVLFLLETLAHDPTVHEMDKRLCLRRAMAVAAAKGSVATMERIYGISGCRIDAFIVREAVRGSQCGAIEWLYAQLDGCRSEAPANEQTYSNEDRMKLFPGDLLAVAAENGELNVIKTLVKTIEAISSRSAHAPDLIDAAKLTACVAVRSGHHDIVNWLRPRFKVPHERELAKEEHKGPYDASKMRRGTCDLCIRGRNGRRQRRPECLQWRMDYAASCGRLQDTQWFLANHRHHCFSSDAIDEAAINGHLDVVRWLHETQPLLRCTAKAMDGAAANGHLAIVKWLHEYRQEGCTDAALVAAATNGHLDTLKYLSSIGVRGASRALIIGPAGNGHLGVVRWLLLEFGREGKPGVPRLSSLTARGVDAAAANGHIEVVKFLLQLSTENPGCVASALAEAAGNNHEDIVRWLIDEFQAECLAVTELVHFSPTTRTRTLQRGSHVVRAVQSAAMNGHFAMARLLFDFAGMHDANDGVGGSWDVLHKAFISAAGHGHLRVAKRLFQLTDAVDSGDASTTGQDARDALAMTLADALYLAVGGSDVSILRWLCERPELPETLRLRAIDSSSLVIGMNNAAGNADFAMLEWIREQQQAVDFETARGCAERAGHPEVVDWLRAARYGPEEAASQHFDN